MVIIMPDGSRRAFDVSEDTIENILIKLKINPVEVIVAKNGQIAPKDDHISENDEMRIIRAIHGG